MENWQYLFQPHILERGMDYYENDAVGQLKKTASGYRAVVKGTSNYQVDICMKDGSVEEMECDCPYADGGSHCKHMAAVLFAIEDAMGEEEEESSHPLEDHRSGGNKLKKELEEAIGRIPEEELRALLMELAEQEEALQNRILTKYAEGISRRQMIRLKKELETISYRNSDRYGFVDWRHGSTYVRDMEQFLDVQVRNLIDKKYLMEAFELVNALFVQVGNQDIDDSGGETGILADSCYQYWKEILENCGEAERKNMFTWFEENQDAGLVVDYMEEYIQNFLYDEFHDQGLLQKKMAMLDEELGWGDEEGPVPRSYWAGRYGLSDVALKRLEIMAELGASPEEIQAWKTKCWTCPLIRDLQLKEDLEAGRLAQAVALLRESKELDQNDPRLAARHSEKLIRLYQQLGMEQEYRAELIFQISAFRQGNLEFVNMLKNICEPEEWAAFREQILQDDHRRVPRFAFLANEGMYQELLEEIISSNSVSAMDQYEKTLGKELPLQVRDFYADYLRKEADSASCRTHYHGLVNYLKKLRSYPDGKELAAQIAREWQNTYRRRPAMMDELRKAGFV